MVKGRKFKFPNPSDCKAGQPAMLCPAERVLKLYNQDNGKDAKRISKSVRAWFGTTAEQQGWAGVHFLPEVQSNYGAGCILWPPPPQINISVNITKQTLVLKAE